MKELFNFTFINDAWAKLICLSLAVILWGFVKSLKISTSKVNVPLQIENIPKKIIFTSSLPKFATLYLRGEKENLRFPTSNLKAVLDMSSTKIGTNILIPSFNRDQLPNKIELESIQEIHISFENLMQKKLWVKFLLKGQVDEGYQVGQVVATPNRIIVSGPASRLKNIYEIYTQKISVENSRDSFNTVVPLIAPDPSISFVDQDKVNVSIRVFQTNVMNKKMLEKVPINILELNPDYDVSLNKNHVRIYLEGNPEILEEVSFEDLQVSIHLDSIIFPEIDEQGKEVGEHPETTLSIPVQVILTRFENKVSIVQVEPRELKITLTRKKTNDLLPIPDEKQPVSQ